MQATIGEESSRVNIEPLRTSPADIDPPFASALPQGEPIASIVVSAESLRAAAEGQEGFVRLRIYDAGAVQQREVCAADGGGRRRRMVVLATALRDGGDVVHARSSGYVSPPEIGATAGFCGCRPPVQVTEQVVAGYQTPLLPRPFAPAARSG